MSFAVGALVPCSSPTSLLPLEVGHGLKPTPDWYKWRLLLAYDGTQYAGKSLMSERGFANIIKVTDIYKFRDQDGVYLNFRRIPNLSYISLKATHEGWQYQESPPTVQCAVEKALTQATKLQRKDLCLVGASRTDAGVHAWGQVAQFFTPFNYDNLEELHAALNGLLPSDIRVREISPASAEFHARFSAKSKIYHYKIYNDTVMDPLQRQFAYHSVYKLNSAVMREAAKYYVGKHDFSAFANASHNDRVPDPVKHIFRFDVKEMGALLQVEVEGSGFLYRQVRNMVALLLQIGREAVPPYIVSHILASRDRKELAKYSLSAPPHGLCLVSINYNESHLLSPPGCPANSFGRRHTIRKCKIPFFL